MTRPLRLVVFDATDVGRYVPARAGSADGAGRRHIGLAPIWSLGARLYGLVGSADRWLAARSWTEALSWAVAESRAASRPIGSLQAWGHGVWGSMQVGPERLDRAALLGDHALAPALDDLARLISGPDALLWLRCCSAFGHHGRIFAGELAARLGCRVAGHTYVIGFHQSGTHSLEPGAEPTWDPGEGVRFVRGEAAGALASSAAAPQTVTCLTSRLPAGY